MSQSSPFDVRDRVVIVTGGAGQLGRAFTTSLGAAGAELAVIDRVPVKETESLLSVACDITDRSALEKALAHIEARWEAPSGLVNAAALDSPPDHGIEHIRPQAVAWRLDGDVLRREHVTCGQIPRRDELLRHLLDGPNLAVIAALFAIAER